MEARGGFLRVNACLIGKGENDVFVEVSWEGAGEEGYAAVKERHPRLVRLPGEASPPIQMLLGRRTWCDEN